MTASLFGLTGTQALASAYWPFVILILGLVWIEERRARYVFCVRQGGAR